MAGLILAMVDLDNSLIYYPLQFEPAATRRKTYAIILNVFKAICHCLKANRNSFQKPKLHYRSVLPVPGENTLCEDDRNFEDFSDLACESLNEWEEDRRSGTWQFMSAWSMKYPKKVHQLQDDLESFIHLLNWLCLRFQPHDVGPGWLETHIYHTYDRRTKCKGGLYTGGDAKIRQMQSRNVPFTVYDNPSLDDLLQSLAALCRMHRIASYEESAQHLSDYVSGATMRQPSTIERFLCATQRRTTAADMERAHHSARTSNQVLTNHDGIIAVLGRVVSRGDWPEHDKQPDQFTSFASGTQFASAWSGYHRWDRVLVTGSAERCDILKN